VTAPVGPTGLVQRCHGDEPAVSNRVGVTWAAMRTTLVAGQDKLALAQMAVTASYELHLGKRDTLVFGAGGVVDGSLRYADHIYGLGPGGTASVGYSHLFVEPKGFVPFVMASASLSATGAATDVSSYWAFDGRVGVAVGWVLLQRLSPYVTARAFGGPVVWHGLNATDAYHVQVGGGLVLGLPFGFDVSAECIPLGEQSVSASLGYAF
jgi:hypothetical protein